MIGRMFALIAASLSGLTMPAFAQPRPLPAWQVDWGDQYCTLIRLPSAETPFVIGMRTIPGSLGANLRLVRRGDDPFPRGIASVALAPSGRTFEVTSHTEIIQGGESVLGLTGLPEEFWDVLATATELHLRRGETVARSIPLSHTNAAVRSLRRCVSDAMAQWGMDEAALRALRQLPQSTNTFGLMNDDYPESAIRAGISGRLVVRVRVSAEGRATDCAVVATSGHVPFDEAACRAILRRGRFSPALDANGQPTSIAFAAAVMWLISR
jgi:TonB family protein